MGLDKTSAGLRCARLALALGTVLVLGCATPAAQEGPQLSPAYPVVLVHGFAGYAHSKVTGDYFRGAKEALTSRGIEVRVPSLPPYASSFERGRVLGIAVDQVLAETGAHKVHIIAHSQGGLDARVLVNALGYGDKVASLTTLSTPHRGTKVADMFRKVPVLPYDFLFTIFGHAVLRDGPVGKVDGQGSLASVSVEGAAAFNTKFPDDPRVPIFSFAGVAGKPNPDECRGEWGTFRARAPAAEGWLTPSWAFLGGTDPHAFLSNDGVVTVQSSRWGRFLGCLPADHVALVGMGGFRMSAPDVEEFDAVAFLVAYTERLQRLDRGVVDAMLRDPEHGPVISSRGVFP